MVVQGNEVIQAVRELVSGEKDLHCPITDEYLLRFIRASNYDVTLSHKLVKDYFKARKDHPEEFVFGPAADYMGTLAHPEFGFVVPHHDRAGRAIIILRLGALDPFAMEWEQTIQGAALVMEACSLDPAIQESGVSLIVDCTDFSLRLMKWATPHKLKVITKFLQDSIPLRFENFLLVNAPAVFSAFWSALKPFMNENLVRKVSWHKAPHTKLHEIIDPVYLPDWMSGTLDLRSIQYWYEDILKKDEILREHSKYGYEIASS